MAGLTMDKLQREREHAWKQLQTIIHPDILQAPRLDWSMVPGRYFSYLYNEVRDKPWLNQLALSIALNISYLKLSRSTTDKRIYGMNARWRVLFPRYGLTSFAEWDPSIHFIRYFGDTELLDTFQTRQNFLETYILNTHGIAAYLRTLPPTEQEKYRQWVLPILPRDLYQRLSRSGEVVTDQRQRRKEEVDAIVPHFGHMRGEAHLRWNQLKRLRDKIREVVEICQGGQGLPIAFSYEEPQLRRRLHFRLWDRYSFFEKHAKQYAHSAKTEHKAKTGAFSPEKNHFFIEFLYAEDLKDGTRDANVMLWFTDLLRYNLLTAHASRGSEEERENQQRYLQQWGYREENDDEITHPFRAIPGVLGCTASQAAFHITAQKRTKGLLFMVEPLYVGATFGLAALDFFTTTGARNGELIQLSLDGDCLYTFEVEGVQRFLVRLVPKNTKKPADYVVGAETRRNLERVGDLLQEHYALRPGEHIPHVSFNPQNQRADDFEKPRPYLFQYNSQHFFEGAINACLRFLCHGMVFQTAEGKMVKLKAHVLRHVFATHLHQVEAVPLDVLAVMMHQKNVQVTAYYAAPPWQQVLATANSLLDKFATHLGSVEEAFVRAPAELQRQLEDAKAQVGTLNKTPGGQCTCHALCPISFACTGCVYNVPDPDREDEILEQEHWAFIRLDQVKKRGLGPEAVKMQALIQRCQITREEMQLIRTYRKDEGYVSNLTIEGDEEKTAPMVVDSLPEET